jgi:hypothetical protein
METSETRDGVELHGDVTVQDYARFIWWHQTHTVAAKVALVVWAAVIPALVIGAIVAERARAAFLVLALFAALYWLLVWALRRQVVHKAYASNKLLQGRHHHVFAAEGVKSKVPSASSENSWDIYWRAVEAKSAFYLYAATNLAVILPKRCFTSEEQMQRFREIARAALGDKARGIKG